MCANADATLVGGIVSSLERNLSAFSIIEPFSLAWYNDTLTDEIKCAEIVPVTGGANALGVLIGNTRELWEVFIDECRRNPELLEQADPLDTYVVRTITTAAQQGGAPPPSRIIWSHVPEDLGGQYVAMQHLAAAIGFAYLDNTSHLCLHPKHGPWFSMRAVLVWDDITYTAPRPPLLPNPLDSKTEQYVRFVARCARNSFSGRGDLSPMGSPTSAAFCSRASTSPTATLSPRNSMASRTSTDDEASPAPELVRACWEKWVAVRDAPCPGHPRRFTRDQLEYHYTHDRAVLQRAVDATVGKDGSKGCEPLRIVTRVGSSSRAPWVLVWSA